MPRGLIRYEHTGNFHFLTFSCYHRFSYLGAPEACDLFEDALERVRERYRYVVAGYVVMPEHVHLLIGEPVKGVVSGVIHALKLSVVMRRAERPFWQARYYDFFVHNEEKRVEKLRYMHRNPVVRGLVEKPEQWRGPASGITRAESKEESRSNRSGPRSGGAISCLNICVIGKRPVEVRGFPRAQRRGAFTPGRRPIRGDPEPGAPAHSFPSWLMNQRS
jgi:putative transposase